MRFGLSDNVIATVNAIFKQYPNVEKAVLYGSRAKGNYKNGSDIDLSLIGEALTYDDLLSISGDLDDSYIPHKVDLSIFDCIDNAKLREHIERVGVVFYERAEKMAGWEVKRFEDCIEKVVYTKKIQKNEFLENGIFPIISQEQDLINGYWNNSSDLFKIRKPIIVFGDHTQVLKYIDFDFVLGADGVKILQPKKNIDSKYFYYFIMSTEIKKLGYARHYRLLKEIEVPLPPLAEQQSIVAILDEVFAGIAKAKENAERNLKNARDIFESYLQNVFTNAGDDWEEKKLGSLGTITSSKRIYKNEYVSNGVPFYRTKELKELANGKNISLELFISKERYNEIKKSFGVPQIGDVLISAVGTIGEILVISNNDEFYFKDGNIVWLKEFNTLDANYLKYALTAFVETIKSLSIGSAYNALTIEKLNEHKIFVPPLLEQQAIVTKLDSISAQTKRLESIYQKKNAHLEELKKSILQKAFAGELTAEASKIRVKI